MEGACQSSGKPVLFGPFLLFRLWTRATQDGRELRVLHERGCWRWTRTWVLARRVHLPPSLLQALSSNTAFKGFLNSVTRPGYGRHFLPWGPAVPLSIHLQQFGQVFLKVPILLSRKIAALQVSAIYRLAHESLFLAYVQKQREQSHP